MDQIKKRALKSKFTKAGKELNDHITQRSFLETLEWAV